MICSVCCNRNILYRPIPTLLRKVKWPVKHDNLKWSDYSNGCTLTVRRLSAYAPLTDYSRFTVRCLSPTLAACSPRHAFHMPHASKTACSLCHAFANCATLFHMHACTTWHALVATLYVWYLRTSSITVPFFHIRIHKCAILNCTI